MRFVLGLIGLFLTSPVYAQSFYSTDQGSGMIHELSPGVQFSTGPLSGMAVEITPGITRYSYQDREGTPKTGQRVDLAPPPPEPRYDLERRNLFSEKPAPWDTPLFRER